MAFEKAQKRKLKLKAAISGVSGGGKTVGALRVARGLAGKKGRIAVIDTENRSASLYADKFAFDVKELEPPYTTDKYIAALKEAEDAGFDVCIIDSASHAWSGQGGILERKDAKDARGGNSYANWRDFTKEHNRFMAAILHSPIHVICTMRSKQAHEIVDNGGKKRVQKMGLKSEQRDGVEYEFTVAFDVAINHTCEASKDRTGLYENKIFQLTEETGAELATWLDGGVDECEGLVKQLIEKLKGVESADFTGNCESYIEGNDKDAHKLKSLLVRIDKELKDQLEKPAADEVTTDDINF